MLSASLRTAVAILCGGALSRGLQWLVPNAGDHPQLTAEEKAVLAHLRLVQIDDGFGNSLATIRVEGANLQIVNGVGATSTTNGLGNLIVGYNEASSAPNRTGSHNFICGQANDYVSYGGIASGSATQLLDKYCAVIAGSGSAVRAPQCVVIGGSGNDVDGGGSVAIGGSQNRVTGLSNVIISGQQNELEAGFGNVILASDFSRIEGCADFNAIIGGQDNLIDDGDWNVVAAGQHNELDYSYFVGALSGSDNEAIGASHGSLVGGVNNAIDPTGSSTCIDGAVLVGGEGNKALLGDTQTVVGGQGNSALGSWSVVGGGLNRSATGKHDWVAGALFQDN